MTYDVYLAHHGILGMKWGVRRYQNADGSLTAAGRQRYDVGDKSSKSVSIFSGKTSKNLSSSSSTTGKKTTREQKFVNKYLEEGMSKEDALLAARKRVRMEKILAVTAGVTVAALAAYAGKKMWDTRVDKFIPKGTLLRNLSTDSNKGIDDAFYAAFKEKDRLHYRFAFARKLEVDHPDLNIFDTKIRVNKRLKIASEDRAVRMLRNLSKDPSYKKELEKFVSSVDNLILETDPDRHSSLAKTAVKAVESLRRGNIDTSVYDVVNVGMVRHDIPTYRKVVGGLQNALKAKGYDAIVDVNDTKYSGLIASKPLIVFGGSKKLSVLGREVVPRGDFIDAQRKYAEIAIDEEVQKLGAEALRKHRQYKIHQIIKNTGIVSGLGGFAGGLTYWKYNQIVSDYRNEHPGTKLSDQEILRNYFGN